MASPVDICNLALGAVGANPISDLAESSSQAELCSRFYDLSLDLCLQAFDWTFASTRQAAIAQASTPPAFGWTARYLIPAACLQVRDVRDQSGNRYEENTWAQENGYILLNADPGVAIGLRYTARITDTALLPPDLVEAVAYRLAAFLAIPMTENRQLRDSCLQDYGRALVAAMLWDGKRKAKETMPDPVQPTSSADGQASPYIPDSISAR